MANEGLVVIKSNKQLMDEQRDRELRVVEKEQSQLRPEVDRLSGYIDVCFTAAKSGKREIERDILNAMRQRKGEYDTETKQMLERIGGADVFMQLTDIKCRAAESWLRDILLPASDRPWSIDPTPIPDIPEDTRQKIDQRLLMEYSIALEAFGASGVITPLELQDKADGMYKEEKLRVEDHAKKEAQKIIRIIDDELVEGKWYDEMSLFIKDLVELPAGFMRGPIYRKKYILQWIPDPMTGQVRPQGIRSLVRTYERVHPLDVFPSKGAKSLHDGYLCLKCRFTRMNLNEMIGVEGFDETKIRMVLAEYGEKGFRQWEHPDQERADLADRPKEHTSFEAYIDGVEFFGEVQGKMLLDWGMAPELVPDPLIDYNITAIKVGRHVVMARINQHPLKKRNIWSTSFSKGDGIWGKGIPQMMEDIQRICNACARALVNNMSLASGPQIWLNYSRMNKGEQVTQIHPLKIWQFTDDSFMDGKPPIGFFQPDPIVDVLLKLYDYFFKQASEVTGVPNYVYGIPETAGAARTASGLSMLMNAASKGLKNVANNVDNDITKPMIDEHWLNVMLYDIDRPEVQTYTGDIHVRARASDYLIQQEQIQMRLTDLANTLNNPTDLQIMGLGGRAEILRELLKSLKMDVRNIIPEDDDIRKGEMEARIIQIITNIGQVLGVDPNLLLQIGTQQIKAPQQGQPQQQQQGGGPNPEMRASNEMGNQVNQFAGAQGQSGR
jgi:hypothetical protein